MGHKYRPLLALPIILLLVVIVAASWRRPAFGFESTYTGLAQISGPVQLSLSVFPPVAAPGQTMSLNILLINQTAQSHAPQIIVKLPEGINLDNNSLPPGITHNLQTNDLNWLPAVSNSAQIAIPLRIDKADIANPEQFVSLFLILDGNQFQADAPIWIGIPPQIEEVIGPAQFAVGQPIRLRAAVQGSGPFIRSWDLGDGRLIEVNEPEVVYPAPGIYQVTLTAANPLTAVSRSRSITVVPHPAAQFTLDDFSPGVDQPVSFTSQSGGQPPLSYAWDFGDGGTADTANPSHQYSAPGTYQVRLEVQNAYGRSEAYWPVQVGSPPIADMVVPESAPAGEPVSGQAFGDDTVTLYQWDMGDGHTYQGELINHTYTRLGEFYVSMTASNEFGDTQIGRWLSVSGGTLSIYLPLINHAVIQTGAALDPTGDPFAVELAPVELDKPFVMRPIPIPDGTSLAGQLFLYINEARRQFNLPPLANVTELNTAAQQHADDMASFAYTAHMGADGSFPAERLLTSQYSGGYAGEATAWGFEHPSQAVEFWVNSPAHRRIILNQFATDLGVGYTVDFSAPNVWYWTAEFGNNRLPPIQPVLRLNLPLADDPTQLEAPVEEGEAPPIFPLISDVLTYSWNWPLPLAEGQHFVFYMIVDGQALPVGTVAEPLLASRYVLETAAYPDALDYQTELSLVQWQVRLEDEKGFVSAQSERRALLLDPDLSLPAPEPVATPTPSPTPPPSPTPLPTSTPILSTPKPQPTIPGPPIFVTATPQP